MILKTKDLAKIKRSVFSVQKETFGSIGAEAKNLYKKQLILITKDLANVDPENKRLTQIDPENKGLNPKPEFSVQRSERNLWQHRSGSEKSLQKTQLILITKDLDEWILKTKDLQVRS